MNNVYTIWGIVFSIGEDYVDLRPDNSVGNCVRAYLPVDEIIKLKTFTAIQVVGEITDYQREEDPSPWGDFSYYAISLENAYLISDTYEIDKGRVSLIARDSTSSNLTCEVSDDNFGKIYLRCTRNEISSIPTTSEYDNYTISATGPIALEVVYNNKYSAVMNWDTMSLDKK